MSKKFPRFPSKPHKSGQARIVIDAKTVYLGVFGSSAARQEYARLKKEWERTRALPPLPEGSARTVLNLATMFLAHAKTYYRRKDGTRTKEYATYAQTVKPLLRLFGGTAVAEFGKKELKTVREAMITGSWLTAEERAKRQRNGQSCVLSRKVANARITKIKNIFFWGEEEEYIPEGIYGRLAIVKGLKEGRTTAEDYDEVPPVPDAVVDATLPFLGPVAGAMVQIQRGTGMRPGEVCNLRPCDIDRTGLVVAGVTIWVYRPKSHKMEYKGRQRAIPIGPKVQALLLPFLDRPAESYCFTPAESAAATQAERRKKRTYPLWPSHLKNIAKQKAKRTRRKFLDHFTPTAYYNRVRGAAKRAKVQAWTPNQLRHSMLTEADHLYGIDAARALAGHANPKVTAVYAAADLLKAAQIVAQIG